MRLSEKITQAVIEGQARDLTDAYQGAMEEVERLRAKVEAMEKQEPVAFRWELKAGQYTYVDKPEHASKNDRIVPLYLAPGAQPAPSVPVDLITDYLVSISAHVAHQDDPKAQAEIGELLRMLAAAPEAKP